MATVIQVQSVSTITPTSFALPNAAWTNIPGMVLSITPATNTHSIMLMAVVSMDRSSTNTILTRITANGTPVAVGTASGGQIAAYGRWATGTTNFSYLAIDATGYTGAVSYQLQVYGIGANTIYINNDFINSFAGCSTLVLNEIG